MQIKSVQKVTLIDYPGLIASTIFVGACNFRCDYCYNKQLVYSPGSIPTLDEDNLFKDLEARKNFIEGVVVTGGEPTLQAGIEVFIEKIKKLGLSVKLDSNGSRPEVIKRLIDSKLIDYVAMDIKAPLDRYSEIAGIEINTSKIKESVSLLKSSSVDYEFRTTVWDGAFSKEDFTKMYELIKNAKSYFIQNMYPFFSMKPKLLYSPMSKKDILPILELGKSYVQTVKLRGDWF